MQEKQRNLAEWNGKSDKRMVGVPLLLSHEWRHQKLPLAPETVKSHVKRIFDMLSVGKRAQAIARAQSLGLLRTR